MNKYEIKGIVGEGAYGIVYQARHKETGEIGKCLPPQSNHQTNQNADDYTNVCETCSSGFPVVRGSRLVGSDRAVVRMLLLMNYF